MVTKDHTVVSVNTELIERDSASEVSVHISWDNHQEDSESGYQNNNMIFLIEKDAGQRDTDIVAAGTVRVAILLEVITGFIVGKDSVRLCESNELLDGQWVVLIFIWMLSKRLFPVLASNLAHFSFLSDA